MDPNLTTTPPLLRNFMKDCGTSYQLWKGWAFDHKLCKLCCTMQSNYTSRWWSRVVFICSQKAHLYNALHDNAKYCSVQPHQQLPFVLYNIVICWPQQCQIVNAQNRPNLSNQQKSIHASQWFKETVKDESRVAVTVLPYRLDINHLLAKDDCV